MTHIKSGAYFVFHEEKKLIGNLVRMGICCGPGWPFLNTSSLVFFQPACAWCWNRVLTQTGAGDVGSLWQLTEPLRNLCVSGWEAVPVCGRCGHHVPGAQPHLPLSCLRPLGEVSCAVPAPDPHTQGTAAHRERLRKRGWEVNASRGTQKKMCQWKSVWTKLHDLQMHVDVRHKSWRNGKATCFPTGLIFTRTIVNSASPPPSCPCGHTLGVELTCGAPLWLSNVLLRVALLNTKMPRSSIQHFLHSIQTSHPPFSSMRVCQVSQEKFQVLKGIWGWSGFQDVVKGINHTKLNFLYIVNKQ